MAFTGNLNAVALTDIVQLVGIAQKSGTLTVVTGRGRFTVLFRGGYVVDASAVRFARAATEGGGAQGKELRLRANLTGDPSKGMSLEEMAGKIFRLGAGYFNFQAGEPQTDSIAALDVSGLLLETFRQHDEAVRDGAPPANDYEALPGEEPGPEGVLDADASSAPAKPSALRHLHALLKTHAEESGAHDLVGLVLEAARQVFDRALLFEVGDEELRGVAGYSADHGEGGLPDAALAAVRIPRSVHSPLQDVVEAKHIGIGEASAQWWQSYMPAEFGPRPEMEYVALPVVACGSCVMVLYGDTYAHREFADPLRALEVVCKHVGVLVENERLRAARPAGRKPWRAHLFGSRRGRA
ncbi:MAG: DUF4388 domain-containing protein [Acidobacteriota bacterium]|nr:DUF4388 domain-containing protein [Acidobacteriota bacterium]